MPFALKEAVDQELKRLENLGIICKVTMNQSLDVDQYPLPKPEDLFATVANGRVFTKLDLSQAYQQMLLDEESRQYVTINTHLGLYHYTRLPFGVASAPAMFQKAMDMILQGLPGVICYIDDILVSGTSEEEQLPRLEEMLKKLKNYGLRVKKNKCAFLRESVEYLGHKVDASGLHPLSGKVEAIVQAPEPQNVLQLRSFLGLLNYYGKFIKNLATLLHLLNKLLQQNVNWSWSMDCAIAFKQAKQELASSKVLVHYDINLPIKLAADASSYGV
ncbi:hypothetical protein EMCRGX_G018331 [Ephydatia muelleri]